MSGFSFELPAILVLHKGVGHVLHKCVLFLSGSRKKNKAYNTGVKLLNHTE